jgi:hypothetical protein
MTFFNGKSWPLRVVFENHHPNLLAKEETSAAGQQWRHHKDQFLRQVKHMAPII